MSVLVFIDQAEGHIKKSSFEAASYGAKTAELSGTFAEAIVIGQMKDDLSELGKYGIKKVHAISNEALNNFDSKVYTTLIQQLVESTNANTVIFSNNTSGKSIAPRLSIRMKAGLVSGAVALPDITSGFIINSVGVGIAATGTTQSSAVILTKTVNVISGATASVNDGIKLPATTAGVNCIVINTTGATVKVYPNDTGYIDGLAQNIAFSLGAGAKLTFIAASTTQWYSLTAVYG